MLGLFKSLAVIERAVTAVAATLSIAIMLIVTCDVALRYLFNSPLTWAYDLISLYLMAAVFFLVLGDAHRAGAPLAAAGEPMDPDDLVTLHMPLARAEADEIVAHAVTIDRFGNVMLDVEHEELAAFGLRLGHPMAVNGTSCIYTTTFAGVQPGEPLIYEDAYRTLALAVNRGSAAELLGLAIDDEVRIRPPR